MFTITVKVMGDKLKLCSLNVRGLGDRLKRRKLYRMFKLQKSDIVFLQEMHSTKKCANLWESEWDAKCYFSHGESNSRGCSIMLNKKLAKSVEEVRYDIIGRYVVMKVTWNNYTYCLCNVYAPNRCDKEFYEHLLKEVEDMECVFTIIGGDFNLVLNPHKDRSGNISYNTEAQAYLLAKMEEQQLVDIWRLKNNESKLFTWSRYDKSRRRLSWSRTDMFLISAGLADEVHSCDILPGMLTDHSLITLTIENVNNKRGPGIWKLNEKWLNEDLYVEMIEKCVASITHSFQHLDAIQFWEILKYELVNDSKEYSNKMRSKRKHDFFTLKKLLCDMQEVLIQLCTKHIQDTVMVNLKHVNNEIDADLKEDAKSSMFRCQVKYEQEGERSTKYFFNMEKRNFVQKTMYAIYKSDGTLTKDYREILNVQCDYYQQLYTSNPDVKFQLTNRTGIKKSKEEKVSNEEFISKDELFDAMMTLRSGKTPGCDGLGLAFYRKFWKLLVGPFYQMLTLAYDRNMLNPSGKRGVISLIPEKTKDSLQVKNWRPLTLLNYDYKILAKAIAN